MNLSEKIITLRKQKHWSQEELAEKLNVSRQAVSKWENASSIPDLDKIILLSEIFGVSLDDLIKEDTEEVLSFSDTENIKNDASTRFVSMDEASSFLQMKAKTAKPLSLAIAMLVICPVPLILLGGLSEYHLISWSDNMAGGIGVVILLFLVLINVAIIIYIGMLLKKYEYLETEDLTLPYGITETVEQKKIAFDNTHRICTVAGVSLCIFSPIPLLTAAAFSSPDIIYTFCVGILLLLVACAVYLFVWSGTIHGSYNMLLQTDDYTKKKKAENKRNSSIGAIYWCLITAIYLGVSLFTNAWHRTWIIWACAGVLWAALCGILNLLQKN